MLADDADNIEALGELEKLYEREKAWSELGAVLERQVGRDDRRDAEVRHLREAGHPVHREGAERAQATAAWQALLAVEPENRRAQDALKKLYLQSKDWNALEEFYASQNKWDELVRVLERQAETEDEGGRVGLWNKIGELYRDRLNKADRAQKAYEKALSFDGKNLQAALALIPLYEKAKEIKRLGEVLLVELGHVTDAAERRPRMQRLADLLDMGGGDKRGGAAHRAAGARRDARRRMGDHDVAPAGRRERRLARAGRGLRGGGAARRGGVRGGCGPRAARHAGGRVRARAGESRARDRAQPEDHRARAQGPEAVAALERLFIATGRFGDLLAIYDKKLSMAKSKAEELEIRFKLASLYEEEIKQPDKAIELYLAIVAQDPRQLSALAALDRLYQQLGRWKELAATITRRSIFRPTWPRSPS